MHKSPKHVKLLDSPDSIHLAMLVAIHLFTKC
jgi:hypothetical protein